MKSELDPNSHSRVIYHDFDDQNAKDTFNSYKYKHGKSKRIKEWNKDIAYEERFKKKREREENYLKNFHPDDRPILLIKKKHEYKGLEKPEMVQDPTQKEPYYKISQNTNAVDDIGEEIHQLENFIKRKTFVHKSKKTPADMEGLSSVIKIEGIEFLPEGFLELDPILFKDDYAFNTKLDEEFFREEQRKMAVLRRKQYDMRNKKKMRDVSIYVLDEHKNRIIDFLERWYYKNKRKMNNQEIGYVSNLLQIKPEEMKKFQEVFLRKKKLLNLQLLKDHIKQHPNGIPQEMRKYLKNSGNFDEVQPKYMEVKEEYKPSHLPKLKKKLKRPANIKKKFGRNKFPEKLNTIEHEKSLLNPLYKTDKYDDERKELENLYSKQNQTSKNHDKPFQTYNQFSSAFENIVNNANNYRNDNEDNEELKENGQNGKLGMFEEDSGDEKDNEYKNPNYDTNVKMYFDSEINAILDNVKGYQPIIVKKEGEIPESQKYIDSYKQKLLQADPDNPFLQNEKTDSEKHRNQLEQLVDKYDENPTEVKEWAFTNLADMKELENILQDIRNQIKTKRVSVVGKNKKGDKTVIIQKLKPILIGNEYFYQTIEDIKQKGDRNVNVLTKNDRGQLISKIQIPKDKTGQYYTNEVRDCEPEFFGDDIKELVLKNEKEEDVCVQKIRPSQDHLISDDFKKYFDVANFKLGAVTENPTNKKHYLNPIKHGDKIYEQIIIEEKNPEQMTEVLRVVIQSLPDGEEVLNEKVDPGLKSESYLGIISDIDQNLDNTFDDEKEKMEKVQIEIKNDKAETLCVYRLPVLPDKEEMIEEEENLRKSNISRKSNVSRKSSASKKSKKNGVRNSLASKQSQRKSRGGSMVKKMSIKDLISENSFGRNNSKFGNSQMNNSQFENEDDALDQKKTEIPIYRENEETQEKEEIMSFDNQENLKDQKGEDIGLKNRKTARSTNFRNFIIRPTLVGQEYYTQVINELVEEDGDKKAILLTVDENGELLKKEEFDPTLIAENYYNRIVEENLDKNGRKTIILETVNDRGERISKQEFRPSIANALLKNYFDDIIEEVVNDNGEKRVSVFKNNKLDPVLVHQEDVINEEEEENYQDSDMDSEDDIDRNKYFENLVDKYGVDKQAEKKRNLSQFGGTYDGFRTKSKTIAPVAYKHRKTTNLEPHIIEKPKNISGRKYKIPGDGVRRGTRISNLDGDNYKDINDFYLDGKRKSSVVKSKKKPTFEDRKVKNRKTVVGKPKRKSTKNKIKKKRNTILTKIYKERGKKGDNDVDYDHEENLKEKEREREEEEEREREEKEREQREREEEEEREREREREEQEREEQEREEQEREEREREEREREEEEEREREQKEREQREREEEEEKEREQKERKKNQMVDKIFQERDVKNRRSTNKGGKSRSKDKKRHTVLKDYHRKKKPRQNDQENSDEEKEEKQVDNLIKNNKDRRSSRRRSQISRRDSTSRRQSRSPSIMNKSYVDDIDEYVVEKPFKRPSIILSNLFDDREIDRRNSNIEGAKNMIDPKKRHTIMNKYPKGKTRKSISTDKKRRNTQKGKSDPEEDEEEFRNGGRLFDNRIKEEEEIKEMNDLNSEDKDELENEIKEDELNNIMDDIVNDRSESTNKNFDTSSQSKRPKKTTLRESKNYENEDEDNDSMRDKIKEMLEDEDVIKEIEDKIKDGMDKDILDEFFDFCKGAKGDSDYKDSVLFSSLFYFYLDKKSKS